MRDGSDSSRHGFEFLIGRNLDRATFERARALAEKWAAPLQTVLINTGWVTPEDYVRRLASSLDVPFVVGTAFDERIYAPVDATATAPETVARAVAALAAAGRRPILVTDYRLALPDRGEHQRVRLWNAVDGLHRASPEASAKGGSWLWQKIAITLLVGMALGLAITDTALAYFALTWVAAVPFALIVAQRIAVLACAVWDRPTEARLRHATPIGDRDLPTYTVLVPLFREADVLPDLVAALHEIDYPAAKLDILLILEEVDHETRAKVADITLPQSMRVVVVPDAQPRTKPKAMNYALQFARGSFVAVYDAEDIPDPYQLRRAVAVFRSGSEKLGCIQARLNIYNRRSSWFSRQFALEYSALFDGMLPALRRIGTPLLLGGTSNHFPRELLDRLGRWDPYNVTEDADLGIRIARAGLDVAVLDSTTFEEAPAAFRVWLPQRTRWLKGWMQTYLVHMRRPARLLGDLGWWRFATLQCLLGGFLLSALLHPLFYVLLAVEFTRGQPFSSGTTSLEIALWHLALFNLAAGFLSAIVLAILMAVRRGWWRLAASAVFMPFYWLLVSFAAYRALWQLATAPHLWEKTRHGARRGRLRPARLPARMRRASPRTPNYPSPVWPVFPSELLNEPRSARRPGPPAMARRRTINRERIVHDP